MTTDPRDGEVQAAWLWAGLALIALAASFLASFAIVGLLESWGLLAPMALGLRVDLAVLLILFGASGLLGVLVAGRLALGRWLRVRREHVLLPLFGIALAVAVELALHEWAEASIGMYDWDLIGWTAALSFALVALAVARFGVAVAPPGAGAPPLLAARVGAVLVLFVVLSNAPGLADGIGPRSWPLAILVAASAAYAVAVVVPRRSSS